MTPLLVAALMQNRPWTPPPSALPKAFVETTRFLLAHGMGDPRGGEYREATIQASNPDRADQTAVVHGWVVGKRVVTVDGLARRVLESGKPADLQEDLSERIGGLGRPTPQGQRFPIYEVDGDWRPLCGAVLLVAGRVDLAERVVPVDPRSDPSAGMLRSFLTRWYHRTVAAHETGRDAETAEVGKALLRERPAFEAEGLRLEGQRIATDAQGRTFRTDEQYPFLDALPAFVADARRRLAHPRPALDLAALAKRPPEERVRTLVDRLDEVAARQIYQPGSVPLESDPIVKALAAEGDAAVPALFEAMAHDGRLTRSVGYHRNFMPERFPKTVREAAYAAFQEIMGVKELPPLADLPALRVRWETNRGLTPAERRLRILQDDQAGLNAWQEAARSLFGDGVWTPRPHPLPAEALRTSRGEAVRDALARRAKSLAEKAQEDRTRFGTEMDLALTLATDLVLWAPDEALPTLRAVTDRAMSPDVPLEWLREPFAEAMRMRGDREGASAWNAYAAWIERDRTDPLALRGTEAFQPLLERRNVPELRAAMRAVLASPDSSWSVAQRARTVRAFSWLQTFLLSPLLDDAVFREATLASLDDRTLVGSVTVEASDMVIFNDDLSGSRSGGYGRGDDLRVLTDPLRPAFGQKVPARACDQVATALARLKGAPPYRPYWPEAKRDEGIAALKAFLRDHAGKLEGLLPDPDFTGRR